MSPLLRICPGSLIYFIHHITYRHARTKPLFSIRPRDCFGPLELFQACASVEAAEAAGFGAAVRDVGLVVDGHIVDVDGSDGIKC